MRREFPVSPNGGAAWVGGSTSSQPAPLAGFRGWAGHAMADVLDLAELFNVRMEEFAWGCRRW